MSIYDTVLYYDEHGALHQLATFSGVEIAVLEDWINKGNRPSRRDYKKLCDYIN